MNTTKTKSPDLSGHHDCPCRDCFEIAIGTEPDGSASLCNACEDADCDADGDSECECPVFDEHDEDNGCSCQDCHNQPAFRALPADQYADSDRSDYE